MQALKYVRKVLVAPVARFAANRSAVETTAQTQYS